MNNIPETIINGVQYIKLSIHNRLIAKAQAKYNLLYSKYYKANKNVKVLSKIYEDLKTEYPEIYWGLTDKYKKDWADFGRVIDLNEEIKKITEGRDYGVCAKCGVESQMLLKGEIISKRLSIDHIFERSDGGVDKKENMQILCIECHRLKTRYFQYIRHKLKKNCGVFTEELAKQYNQKWLKNDKIEE